MVKSKLNWLVFFAVLMLTVAASYLCCVYFLGDQRRLIKVQYPIIQHYERLTIASLGSLIDGNHHKEEGQNTGPRAAC